MNKQKKILKYVLLLIIGCVGVLYIVINFSAVESSFKCIGQLSYDRKSQPVTVYLKLSEYRPWVGLWGDSDASVNLEIPNEWFASYNYIEKVGDYLQIYETYPQKTLKGNFSHLSKSLAIDLGSAYGFFEGNCVDTK